jgi:hypothetical protein
MAAMAVRRIDGVSVATAFRTTAGACGRSKVAMEQGGDSQVSKPWEREWKNLNLKLSTRQNEKHGLITQQQNNSTDPQRNAPHRTAPHRTAPQHNAPQHNAPQRNAPQRNATQRNATQRNEKYNRTNKGQP